MSNAIIIIALIMVCIFAVKSYMRKLSHGCCGAGGDAVEKVRVQDKDPSHYPYQTELMIDGMTCKNCKLRVENTLNAEDGFWARADLKEGRVLVHSKQPAEEMKLCRLVSRAGYRVTAVNGKPPKAVT